jgi:hypothetical protein
MKSADNLDRVREETAQWMYDLLTSSGRDETTAVPERKSTEPIRIAVFEC